MFSLRDFLMKGFKNAIGKMADYQIILNASGWLEKGVLTETDLAEINEAMENYIPPNNENETFPEDEPSNGIENNPLTETEEENETNISDLI